MTDANKTEFWALLQETLSVWTDKDVKPKAKGWWLALQPYSMDEIRNCFARLVRENKFEPKPADAIAILNEQLENIWLGADEAWAAVLLMTDEDRSTFTTDAIDEACLNLNELIVSDQIAGRMAFKSAYERIMKQWKAQGRVPKVRFAAGLDKIEREEVIKTAVQYGAITHEQAKHYLPAPKVVAADLVRIAQDNVGKVPEAEKALSALKDMLGIGEHAKQKKWLTPDRVWEEGGVMYVRFGDEVKRLDELEDRKAA